jgi:DNA-binding NarL/FixJ family response regulator
MIVEAIHRVAAGEPMLSPGVTAQLIRRVVSAPAAGSDAGSDAGGARAAAARPATLGEREREVAVAVGRGRSDAEIAGELAMSLATVEAHVSYILVETGVSNRVQIASCVHEAGLA